MDTGDFLCALDEALGKHRPEITSAKWSQYAYRTHFMKGNAVKGEVAGCDRGVLQDTMKKLRYECSPNGLLDDGKGSPEIAHHRRVYGWEWQQIDLVAARSPGPWGECVWKGQYRIDLALELENNIAEFTLHMRGLLDFNAVLRVGIFYATEGKLDQVKVGSGNGLIPLAAWTPPWKDSTWGGRPLEDDSVLLAVFLSEQKPEVLGARQWSLRNAEGEDVLWKASSQGGAAAS